MKRVPLPQLREHEPMHKNKIMELPPMPRSTRRACVYLAAFAAILMGIAGCTTGGNGQSSKKEATLNGSRSLIEDVHIRTESVQKRPLTDSLHVTGQVLPEIGKEVSLTNRVTGRVVSILVAPGQHVAVGQVLALIDSQQISDLQAELIEAHSKLDIAKAHEERERQIYGEQLKRPKALIEARARFDEAKVQSDLTERELKRVEQLHKERIAAAKDLLAAQASYAKSQSIHRQTKADLEREEGLYENKAMMKRDLQVVQAETRRAQQHLNTLRQRLVFLGMTPSKVDHVIATGQIIGTIPIIAPLAGIVTQQDVALGEIVDPGKQAFRITDLSTVAISADIPDMQLPKLKIGMQVKARINGYPDQTFTGTINYIGTHVNPETRTAPIRARLVNTDMKLRASLFADTEIELPPHMVLTCPKEAIQERNGKKVVYLAVQQKFREQPVQVGRSNEKYYEVISGLDEGDQVVTAGSLLLKAQVSAGHSHSAISDSGAPQQ